MESNWVNVKETEEGPVLEFSASFNAVALFIDRHLSEGRAAKIAIRTKTEDITYEKLAMNVNRCGNALLGLGLQPKERLLMVIKDCPQFFYLFWGAIKTGIIPVPVNGLLRSDTFASLIEDSHCAAVAYSLDYAEEVIPALSAKRGWEVHALPVEGEGKSLAVLMNDALSDLATIPATADSDCFWYYSSGTTGMSKGVVHPQRSLVATSQLMGVNTFGVREDDIFFAASKLFFAYGLGFAANFPLWVGGTAILDPRRPTPQTVMEMIERFRPTVFAAVPTFYATMLRDLETENPDFSSLRICSSAGEPLPADLLRRWQKKTHLPLLDGIGSTENLNNFIANRPDDVRPACSGQVVPGYQAEIRDENHQKVPIGEIGTLWIKGPSVASKYWNKPEKNAETFVDGWAKTGDVFSRDQGGYFYYQGRNDDMLKVGGIYVSPFEIESALSEHAKVLEAGVVGQPDHEGLLKPKAWVVLNDLKDTNQKMVEDLQQHCKKRLAPYMYPRWIVFVEDLPKTATGKIRRFLLRQRG